MPSLALIKPIMVVIVLVVSIAPLAGAAGVVNARSLQDIQNEIDAQNGALTSTQQQLAQQEAALAALNASASSAQGQIPQLEIQIKQLEATIELNVLQLQVLSESKVLKDLEKEEREKQQDYAIKNSYRNWKSTNKIGTNLFSGNRHPVKSKMYQSQVISTEQTGIENLQQQILGIATQITEFKTETASLEQQITELEQKKTQLEQQLAWLRQSAQSTSGQISGLRAQASVLQSNIAQLSAEQKALQDYEAWLLGQSGNGGTQQIQSGQFYFTGRGRDLYQGHGVGMSQFGAYGAAQQGWSAQQILQFYYTDTHIEERPGNINVQGYGVMDIDTYVAGLGEVPSKACGSAQQAAERPDKYVVDNPNTVWDCWPEEAIKAQVIAARSYALTSAQPICTSDACQVYVGGEAKRWAATETSGQVVVSHGYTHNGQIIHALYSSDNNQGYGTAHNDTIFSGNDGTGTPYSYLRHVDDNAFAYRFAYTDWGWRTNGYSMQQFTQLLNYSRTNTNLSSGQRNYITNMFNTVGGNVANVTFERDPSQRVKRVIFTGTNGNSAHMAGWLFKAVWNSWVFEARPSGELDYIYSLTFFLLQG